MKRITSIVLLVAGAPALAQSDVSQTNKFSWQENAGWMDWRDANSGAQGVRDRATYLSGFIWCENVGWVNLGSAPANSVSFTNTSGTDFGVNIAAGGGLSGFAWGENVGWINFSGGALANPPQPARLDVPAERLRGFAWGENIGWVNLDLPSSEEFVQRICYANCDASSTTPQLNVADFTCFLQKFAAGDAYANCDRSVTTPNLNVADFTCFLQKFAQGCP